MRSILLTPDGIATHIDNCDFIALSRWEWYLHCDGYAVRQIWYNGKNYMIYMHRQILGLTDHDLECDHINGDRLDNRFCNLREATSQQNRQNQVIRKRGTSKYKGVYLPKDCKRWRSQIFHNRHCIVIGYFTSELDAALAYNTKAIELFGVFAKLNTFDCEECTKGFTP